MLGSSYKNLHLGH